MHRRGGGRGARRDTGITGMVMQPRGRVVGALSWQTAQEVATRTLLPGGAVGRRPGGDSRVPSTHGDRSQARGVSQG